MCGERRRTPRHVRAARSCQRSSYGGGRVPAILRLVIRALRRARLAPLAAAVALFATMPITVSSLLHDETDDAICNPAVVVHDAAAHRIGAASHALPDSQHCVLCHTLQSLRAVSAALRFAGPTVDARLVSGASTAAINALIVSSRLARAPPSA